MPTPFLTARWESLLLINYRCPADLLEPLVPKGTELDPWDGHALVSLVGFRFVDTRVKGCVIPWHRTFEEVNLRFYVRREVDGEVRRGVVFVRELVPRRAIATVAKVLYNEPYLAVPMSHDVSLDEERGGSVRYAWRHRGSTYALEATPTGPAQDLTEGSEAEFITEHYWGYNRQRDGSSMEYKVEHPPWKVWAPPNAIYTRPDGPGIYGPAFSDILEQPHVSAFVAVGSEVSVFPGTRIATP